MGEIDFKRITAGIKAAREAYQPGDLAKIYLAIESLRSLPLAPAYLNGVRDELVSMVCDLRVRGQHDTTPTSVYLSFYGTESRASFLKIGIAKDVRKRLAGHATSNPMPNLWTFAGAFGTRHKAGLVEAALLRHMANDKAHGEWLHVHGLSLDAAMEVVQSLAEVASDLAGGPVTFLRLEV